jgi:hypothetical protein
MSNLISESQPWAATLRAAIAHGAGSETAIQLADRAGQIVRQRNAAIEVFALLGWDLVDNCALPLEHDDFGWNHPKSESGSDSIG